MKLRFIDVRRSTERDDLGKKIKKKNEMKKTVGAVAAVITAPLIASAALAQDDKPADSEEGVIRMEEADAGLGGVNPASDLQDPWRPMDSPFTGDGGVVEEPMADEADAGVPDRPLPSPFDGDASVEEPGPNLSGEAGVQVDDRVVWHNLFFKRADEAEGPTQYQDPAMSPNNDVVDLMGRPRRINLNNNWDIGGNLVVNEAGSAISPSIRYRDLVRLDLGGMWFGEQGSPFARLMLRPELNIWRFKFVYYGSVATMGNMPSSVYSSHSVGGGFSAPFHENFVVRAGIVGGGALSYPAWDDVYFNLVTGLSMQIYKNAVLYGMPTFYYAAPDPMATAYLGYYKPEFQNVECGIQGNVAEYTIRGFADFGRLRNRYGLRGTRTIDFSSKVQGDIWVAGGITHWDSQLGGRVDPLVMAGATIVVGGEYVNSTNTVRYSHLQNGGIEFAETEFPTSENPGPYGFGRAGLPEDIERVNVAKERIMDSTSFESFANSYRNASEDDVIFAARFLGAFLQQVAYANDAYDALNNTDFFDKSVKDVASADVNDMFAYMQRYIEWYNTRGPDDPLPDYLSDGIAMCSGIHWLMAEFMRANGVDAIVASVNTPDGPHMIAIGQLKDRTVLLDYGNQYMTPAGTLDQTLRFYGQNRQAPTFQSQFFGPDGYMGTYVTSEGRLLHETIGIVNEDVLKRDFLGIR